MLTPDKIIEILVKVDDFCKEFDTAIKNIVRKQMVPKPEIFKPYFQTAKSSPY